MSLPDGADTARRRTGDALPPAGTSLAEPDQRHTAKEGLSMSRRFIAFLVAAPFAFLIPKVAHAGIDACGNIDVKANAKCEVVAQGGCTARCEPVSFQAACSAKLQAQCDGQCAASASADCTASCSGTCTGQCEANPGSFDCKGSCSASCESDCNAQCSGQASGGQASGQCQAECKANCSAKCDARCSGTPPSATCDAKCNASCSGSCEAKASAQCQIQCQGKLDAQCKAELKGGCEAQCQKPEGALYCDGQYVDTGGNLQRCVDALNAILNIKVQGSASAQCSGNTCEAKAEASASACSTSTQQPAQAPLVPIGVIGLAAIGATVARMKRRGDR
jgi:hypothetical protein